MKTTSIPDSILALDLERLCPVIALARKVGPSILASITARTDLPIVIPPPPRRPR